MISSDQNNCVDTLLLAIKRMDTSVPVLPTVGGDDRVV